MGRTYDTLSFLSDYGTADEFVGVVHSVIRSIAPQIGVVDITHEITPHDVRAGSLALVRSVQYLCAGVVLAVVDPGVGTARRAIAVEVGDGMSVLVGPDNGLLAPAVSMCGGAGRVVELTNEAYHLPAPGPTFAGRDIFAVAAANLCNGVDLAELGPAVDPDTLQPGIVPLTQERDGRLLAEVLWVDRFGNCQLNVDPDEIAAWGDVLSVRIGDPERERTAVRAAAFGDVGPGRLGLIVDSYGLAALVLDRASAAEELEIAEGSGVSLGPVAG